MDANKREVAASPGLWFLLIVITISQITQCTATQEQAKASEQQAREQKRMADNLEKIAYQIQLQRIDDQR